MLDFLPLFNLLTEFKPVENISVSNFVPYYSCSAVKHIFSVASGIDSLVLGDSQILGQVKESFEVAEDMKFTCPVLRRIFDTTLKVGKRAIRETALGEGAVTVSYAAVQVVEKIFSSLQKKKGLIIGAGETGELAAVHMRDKEIGSLTICNRTIEKAERLAQKVKGEILPFENLIENLHKFDVIISATSAPSLIITFENVKEMMKKRRGSPSVMMDIAIPRDIDPRARELENVFYHDMDSLQIIVNQNLKKREKEIPKVEKMLMEEMVSFFNWYNTLEVVPVIKQMREFFEEIGEDELRKIKPKVTEDDYQKIENMTRRMIGRLLHNPTFRLKNIAGTGNNPEDVSSYAMMARELFISENDNEQKYEE